MCARMCDGGLNCFPIFEMQQILNGRIKKRNYKTHKTCDIFGRKLIEKCTFQIDWIWFELECHILYPNKYVCMCEP